MRTAVEGLKLLIAIAVLIAVGEVPAVQSWSRMIDGQRGWLLPLTIGVAVVGFVLLLWGWIRVGMLLHQPMTHRGVEQLAARTQILGPGKRFSVARLWGKARGEEVPDLSWTFRDMKQAWRSGDWARDPDWRRKYIITAGGILAVLGLFASLSVLSDPPSVKALLDGAVLYAAVRLTWAFWRA